MAPKRGSRAPIDELHGPFLEIVDGGGALHRVGDLHLLPVIHGDVGLHEEEKERRGVPPEELHGVLHDDLHHRGSVVFEELVDREALPEDTVQGEVHRRHRGVRSEESGAVSVIPQLRGEPPPFPVGVEAAHIEADRVEIHEVAQDLGRREACEAVDPPELPDGFHVGGVGGFEGVVPKIKEVFFFYLRHKF